MAHGFNHMHIKAPDPEKTANWYVKAFGFQIISDTVRDVGDRFIRCKASDGTGVNISEARTNEKLGVGGGATPHWGLEHFGIDVDDLDAEIKRLEGLGADLLEGPVGAPNGPRVAFIRGPDDVRIELVQPAP